MSSWPAAGVAMWPTNGASTVVVPIRIEASAAIGGGSAVPASSDPAPSLLPGPSGSAASRSLGRAVLPERSVDRPAASGSAIVASGEPIEVASARLDADAIAAPSLLSESLPQLGRLATTSQTPSAPHFDMLRGVTAFASDAPCFRVEHTCERGGSACALDAPM